MGVELALRKVNENRPNDLDHYIKVALFDPSSGTPINGAVKTVVAAYIASQTAATVLTPTSGKKVYITDIIISAVGSGTVYLFDNTDVAGNQITPILSFSSNGGMVCNFIQPVPSSAIDNVIKYTSGAGATGSIFLKYFEI